MMIKHDDHRGICKKHYNQGVRMSNYESSSSQQQQHHDSSKLSPLPVLTRENTRLNLIQRHAVIIMHQDGRDVEHIKEKVGCARSSVYHHIKHYNSTHSFDDDQREGNYSQKHKQFTKIHGMQSFLIIF